MRFLPIAAIATGVLAAGVFAGTASADSIVYAKDGNLFLTSPDGAKGYQVTHDGGYSSPSQAADGTIGAIRNKQLVRMDRAGRLLNDPVDAMGSPGSLPGIAGPYDARISPDGKRFAYWFFVQTSYHAPYDPEHRVVLDTGSSTAWTWADRFTDPTTEGEREKLMTQAEWLTNDRLVGTMGFWMNMWTWKIGSGVADSAQYWFGLRDPLDEWGVEAYHWYDDPAVSRDGSELAMTDGGKRLILAATHGPAWQGEPPYENDYLYGDTPLSKPTLECGGEENGATNPSWSSDGRLLAYGATDGVHLVGLPGGLDCTRMTERVLVPGGTEPAFGPADVGAARAPAARTSVRRVALRPRTLHRGGHATLRFTLSAPARVKIGASGHRARRIAGHRGLNRVRFSARGLRPGRYRLSVTPAGGRARTTAFRVVR